MSVRATVLKGGLLVIVLIILEVNNIDAKDTTKTEIGNVFKEIIKRLDGIEETLIHLKKRECDAKVSLGTTNKPDNDQPKQSLITTKRESKAVATKAPAKVTQPSDTVPRNRRRHGSHHSRARHDYSTVVEGDVEMLPLGPLDSATLALSTSKQVLLLNLNTRAWRKVEVKVTPDSLAFDQKRHRLYWLSKSTLGYFSGDKSTSKTIFKKKKYVINTFAVDPESGDIFIVARVRPFKTYIIVIDSDGNEKSNNVLHISFFVTPVNIAVDAEHERLFVSTANCPRGKCDNIGKTTIYTSQFNFEGKRVGNAKNTFDAIPSTIYVDEDFRAFYSDGKNVQTHMLRNDKHTSKAVLQTRADVKLTTSPRHLYVLDKTSVRLFNKNYEAKYDVDLPGLKDADVKAVVVTHP